MQIRQAAATARAALASEAAKLWNVDASELTTIDGDVRAKSGTRRIAYSELVRGKGLRLPVNAQAQLLDPSRYRFVGRSVPRVDIPAKVTGEFMFMQDFRVPGMVHARVVRPPAIGAQLVSIDESSVFGIHGLIKVVRQGTFLAVAAASEWGAIKAAQQLKATWSDWAGLPDESKLWEHVRATRVVKDDVTSDHHALAPKVEAKGALLLECPVSGTVKPAREGTLATDRPSAVRASRASRASLSQA